MREDKCDKCRRINSKCFWDFEDGSVLCDECNNKYGSIVNENSTKSPSADTIIIYS
jgi:hypothetical protein